jgi:hypothetical protein
VAFEHVLRACPANDGGCQQRAQAGLFFSQWLGQGSQLAGVLRGRLDGLGPQEAQALVGTLLNDAVDALNRVGRMQPGASELVQRGAVIAAARMVGLRTAGQEHRFFRINRTWERVQERLGSFRGLGCGARWGT